MRFFACLAVYKTDHQKSQNKGVKNELQKYKHIKPSVKISIIHVRHCHSGGCGKQILKTVLLLIIFFKTSILFAQFPPPVGNEGTTAIHKDSSVFIAWVKACDIDCGLMKISEPDLGFASVGSSESCIGKAVYEVASLGDGGSVILSFDFPIVNGDGWDFAVFENSFDDYFLEFAFVEVSSDGKNFFRFDAVSLTQQTIQVDGFGLLEAEKIHNLAGKYRGGFGTPFDLNELKNISSLNINSISHIKIIDVVGCINEEYAQYDSQGNIINDPWPTPFPSSGFDLDAVGVIHNTKYPGINDSGFNIELFPNPCKKGITITYNISQNLDIIILNSYGQKVLVKEKFLHQGSGKINLSMDDYLHGMYFIHFFFKENSIVKKLVKY